MGNMEPKCWFTAEMAPQRSSVRKEIELAGGGAMRVSGEVTSFSDIEAARLQIEGELGLVDIFVANH